MKFLCALSLLLGLQLCAPQPQAQKKEGRKANDAQTAAPASKSKTTDAARTVICIDPGHPSEVASGMNVQNGTSETRVAWAVAQRLKSVLEADGYEVVLTKSAEGELVKNRDRALVANRARAALMVRLHCDASIESGFAVYYPDRKGQTRDGAASGPAPEVIEGSRRAAEAVRAGMAEGLAGALKDNGVRTDYQTKVGREQGGALTGSIYSEVPVVTIEMVVLSDPDDAEFIKAEAGQQRMAAAIADGVRRFVGPAAAPRKED